MTDLKRLVDESGAAEVERALLESGIGDAPPEGAKARLRGAMGLRPIAAPPAVGAPSGSLFTMVKWVGLAALLVVGAAALRSFVSEPPSEMPAATQQAPEISPATPAAAPSPSPMPAASVAPAVSVAESIVPPPPAPSTPVSLPAVAAQAGKPVSLRAELELLDAIRTDVAGGNAAGACAKLDRYDREFGARGALVDEASVMRVEALLAHGEKARAEAFASRFLASHRGTPYEARIRTLLATH